MLRADPTRVVSKIFLPGLEMDTSGQSRTTQVLDRVLALSDAEVAESLRTTLDAFGPRHHDLIRLLETRFEQVAHRLVDPDGASAQRRQLIGAYFSQEFALEAAAVFNPSMVAHPDQSGLADGSVRFVMSVRAVGEGHLSSIELRTGTVDRTDVVTFDDPGRLTVTPSVVPTRYSRDVFEQQHAQLGGDQSSAAFVLKELPRFFDRGDLDRALGHLREQRLTRGSVGRTLERMEWIAACNYSISFPTGSAMAERVILPRGPSESHGLEDVRLVQFTDDDGSVEYRGTYTAFDGSRVVPQLLRTDDFQTFHVSQLGGPAAKNKGMALFPRRVDGRLLALSRWDREDNTLACSDDLHHWEDAGTVQEPVHPWEIVQIGNCGSPLETDRGWLVLTHGVGPMRQYGIGALLLDLDDPRKVIASLPDPLLTPNSDERDGYVPNVVYSCGGLLHGNTLVLPYGCSDASIRVALVDVDELLKRLERPSAT